jgi:Signal peptidase subunit
MSNNQKNHWCGCTSEAGRRDGRTTIQHHETKSQQKPVCLSLSLLIPSASSMHTLWVRLNAVVFFGLSALLGFSCLAALSKYNHSSKPGTLFCGALIIDVLLLSAPCFALFLIRNTWSVLLLPVIKTLKLNKLKSLKPHGGVDRALLSFDLNVDLTPAFHWYV